MTVRARPAFGFAARGRSRSGLARCRPAPARRCAPCVPPTRRRPARHHLLGRWPRPACSTGNAPRRTGATSSGCARATPGRRWSPTRSTDEGRLLTSAGSAAGLDLCLHIVRRDPTRRSRTRWRGGRWPRRSARVGSRPPPRAGRRRDNGRPGGGPRMGAGAAERRPFGRALGSPGGPVAAHVRAPLPRRDRHAPHRWRRTSGFWPRRAVETSDASIDQVAEGVGLQTAATLRLHFRRALRTTPTAYRRRFSRFSG